MTRLITHRENQDYVIEIAYDPERSGEFIDGKYSAEARLSKIRVR